MSWGEGPWAMVATLKIPKQLFLSDEQVPILLFAYCLCFVFGLGFALLCLLLRLFFARHLSLLKVAVEPTVCFSCHKQFVIVRAAGADVVQCLAGCWLN